MSTVEDPPRTMADLLAQLGVSAERVRFRPAPGMATEQDVVDIEAREKRLYELVDGVLVEKVMGYPESRLAVRISHLIQSYLDRQDIGILAGPDGTLRLAPGKVRVPDVSFVSYSRLPNGEEPTEPIPDLIPDLVVEILSEGNTTAETNRKLEEYFAAGVRLAWIVDPRARSVRVHTSPIKSKLLNEDHTLDGGKVLPGFKMPLRELFARAGRRKSK